MSYAPKAILDVRAYLKPITGLTDNELGIVGDPAHDGGYHCGWDRRKIVNGQLSDYSWTESTRDSSHKTDAASALDVGLFSRLYEMSVWIVAECEAGAPDTADIREIIYSPDGVVVKRWDRLKKRTSGDSSHRKHTHFSWFRDAEARAKTSIFERFFGSAGDDMFCSFGETNDKVKAMQLQLLQLDPTCLPTFGADRNFGAETQAALSRLITGGQPTYYGPDAWAAMQKMVAEHFGGAGAQGPAGPQGPPGPEGPAGPQGPAGLTPTQIRISQVAEVTEVS